MATLPNTRPHHPDPHKNIWYGTFEYVAMYNRFIEEPEAAKNAAVVAAGLAQRNALVVNEYQRENVLKGRHAGKTLRVVQWGMLNLKPTPLAAQEPGASVKLVLETFIDHEELVPELISDTLKEDFDLALSTDVPRIRK